MRVLIHNDGEECLGILSAKYGDVILVQPIFLCVAAKTYGAFY